MKNRTSFRCLALAAALVLAGATAAAAATKAYKLSFAGNITPETAGFRCANLQAGAAQPLPPPDSRTRRWSDGRTEQVFSPQALWFAGEYAGRWENRDGDSLVAGLVTRVMPDVLRKDFVTRAEFEKGIAEAPPATQENLGRWMADFMGAAAPVEPKALAQTPMKLAEVRAASALVEKRLCLAYAFRFRAGVAADTNRWMCAMFMLPATADAVSAARAIEREFLPSIQPAPATTAGRNSGGPKIVGAQGHQAGGAAGEAGNRSAAFLASRQAALDSVKGLKGWWYAETTNYVIITDLPSGKAVLVKEMQYQMEYLRTAFSRVVPPGKMLDAASIIRFFGDSPSYERYVDPSMKWTGGCWDPGRGELVIRPREWGSIKQKNEWLRETLFHEGFHQYLSYAFSRSDASVWYNEGHAALMEGIEFTPNGVRVDEVPRYAALIDEHLKKGVLRVGELTSMDYDKFYAKNEDERKWNYASAWAFVYFLRKGAPLEKDRPWAGLAEKYRAALAETGDGKKAAEKCLEGVDMQALEASLNAFWKSSNRRGEARKFDLFAAKPASP